MDKKLSKNLALLSFVAALFYLFFAVGDLIIKGYSNLTPIPFMLSVIMGGIFLGYYKYHSK